MSALDVICGKLNEQYKLQIASKGMVYSHEEMIPFSSPRANYCTYGGLPRRGMVEFFGEESGGKTTTALQVVANAQKIFTKEWEKQVQELEAKKKRAKWEEEWLTYLKENGPLRAVYVDAEHSLEPGWAALMGVDMENLYLIKPQEQSAEEIFQMIIDLIESKLVGVLVLDSVAKLVTKKQLDGTMLDKTYCGIAGPMTTFCNKFDTIPIEYRPLFIVINQVREAIGDQWAHYITPGGKALKHTCRMRIMFVKGKFIDDGGYEQSNSCENPAGNIVKMQVAKNKVTPSSRRLGFYTLKYRTGVFMSKDYVDTAIQFGLVSQAGSWYTILNPENGEWMYDGDTALRFQGYWKLIEFLENDDNSKWRDWLYGLVDEKIRTY